MQADWLTDSMVEAMSDEEQKDFIRSKLEDQWWRLNNLYHITDKHGKKVLFRMNKAQQLLFKTLWFFNIILKARQLGFSTAIQIFILDSALFNENLECGVIAQGLREAKKIFRTKILYPYDNLPEWLKYELPFIRKTSDEIEFANGSTITVSTSFRSGTVQILHVSEFAKICATREDKAQEVIDGTLNAVHPGNIAFIESTAEGAAGHYFDMCSEAIELQQSGAELSKIDFKFHFFAWWDEPTYVMDVPEGGLVLTRKQEKYFDALEKALGKSIPDERKLWYITKQRQQKEKMPQEFPSTPEEAFLTSGRKVFDSDELMAAKANVTRPLIIYEINPITGEWKKVKRIPADVFKRSYSKDTVAMTSNYLLVWELPSPDRQYVIGADVAEGLEKGDRSSLDVIDKETGWQVAHWFGHVTPKRFGDLLALVGRKYDNAYIGVERNNHGHATIDRLREIYPVGRIHREEYMDRETDDEETKRLGWATTSASKEILISDMDDLFEHERSGIRWAGTMSEFFTFVRDERGRAAATKGGHDDQVMSYMIAQEMRAKAPAKVVKKQETESTTHWMAR